MTDLELAIRQVQKAIDQEKSAPIKDLGSILESLERNAYLRGMTESLRIVEAVKRGLGVLS